MDHDPGAAAITQSTARFASIDVIRGFAVMGILVMNIVSMGMPGYAYIDPTYYGGATGADLWAWILAYVFADGKMRMLFTMLFGASLAIVTDRADRPARTHYSRMVWLLVFGMIHGWFFWYGDILVEYALIGLVLFVARKWPPVALFYAAAILVIFGAAIEISGGIEAARLRDAASVPGATAAARSAWETTLAALRPPSSAVAFELTQYRGGFWDAFAARKPMIILFQTVYLPVTIIGTAGIAAFGLGLYRTGFLTGERRPRTYRLLVVAGVLAALAYIPLVRVIIASGFDPVLMTFTNQISLVLRPFITLAYTSALILVLRAGTLTWLTDRLEAAGRMAFSNYLGTTLVTTTLFYGYGLGLFGRLSRAELYVVVALVWLLILAWSQPWLARFRYGPLEWLWRSLARGAPQPMRKRVIANH